MRHHPSNVPPGDERTAVDRVVKVCDLHEDDVPAVLSVRVVGLGTDRNLDLCAEHRDVLGQLPVAGARDAQPAKPRRAGSSKTATTGKRPGSRRSLQQERALVREWARQQGRDIGDKGRMPSGLIEEYLRTQARNRLSTTARPASSDRSSATA
jgi:hypothetical protein